MDDKPRLKPFIDENSKLISAIGLFIALVIFSKNIEMELFADLFAFVFLFIVIILWTELIEQFPSKEGSWKLIIFENIISYLVLGLVFYWLLEYRYWSKAFLIFPIAVLILSIISKIIKREKIFSWADKPKKRFKLLRYLVATFLLITVFTISFIIAGLISEPVNNFLDNFKETIKSEDFIDK